MILELDANYMRPVVILHGITALVDTGALFPIASMDPQVLIDAFDAKLVIENTSISGFGGECRGSVYKIPCFILSKLTYPDFHVFVPENKNIIETEFLFSATMFNGLVYEFDTVNHKMLIQVPDRESCVRNLKIYDSEGKLYVLVQTQ